MVFELYNNEAVLYFLKERNSTRKGEMAMTVEKIKTKHPKGY